MTEIVRGRKRKIESEIEIVLSSFFRRFLIKNYSLPFLIIIMAVL